MGFFQIFLLSLIQGITEFLPISSSAHLLLFPVFFNFIDQGVVVDIFVHIGSLFAVLYFYRKDIVKIVEDFFNGKYALFIKLCIATVPICIVGGIVFLLKCDLRSPRIVVYTSIIFGALFYIADRFSKEKKSFHQITNKDAFLIGIAQTLSIIPGVSRSGITLTMALFRDVKRESALKFSFLLSIPTIIISGVVGVVDFYKNSSGAVVNGFGVVQSVVLSFIFSLMVIKFLIAWIKKSSFKIFAVYRIVLGIILYLYLK